MRKKRFRQNPLLFEPLEARRLLSAIVQPSPLLASTSTSVQVQPISTVRPTYQILDTGESPFQTAGPQGFTPSEIRTAYGLDQITFGAITGTGAGQTIAIVDAYNDPTIQADLQGFDQAFGLASPTLTVLNQSGGATLPKVDPAGAGNDNWEGEEALDVEWAHAMAPGASIVLIEASDASPSNLFDAVDEARQLSGVAVVSMSWGGNETSTETQFDSILTTPSGHTGVTFVASTGDEGAPSGYPAYSPNVVAAGGTSLSLDALGNYQSETGWSGSGGGISTIETQPPYQNGIVTQSSSFRANPDVAFDADPSTGVSVYDSYNNGAATPWEVVGGTSVASPAWAGIFAVADQGRVLASENTLDSATDTLPLLYTAPASDFHDITTGNNGHAAGTGYDLVTGRGSPIANLLVPFLVTGVVVTPPPPTGPSISSITANATTIAEGSTLTLTANGVSDPGATGVTVTFYQETNSISGLQTDPTTGDNPFTPISSSPYTISLDTTGATGTFTFYAQVTDSSGDATAAGAAAPAITVTIVPPGGAGATIAGISTTPNPVITGDTLTLTANGITDLGGSIRRVYFYEETNGIPGLQTGFGGDFAFRPVTSSNNFSVQLDTTGVTGDVTFYALAVDNFGNSSPDGDSAPSATVDIADNTPPDAPADLVAAAVSSTQVDLSFAETDSSQTGFTIERSQDPAFTTFTHLFTITNPNSLTYEDTGLSPATKYYYRVEAFNTAGNSVFSNIAPITTLPSPAAHPATHLVVSKLPSMLIAGQTIPELTVKVENAADQVVATDNSQVTLAFGPDSGGASIAGVLTAQAVNGIATFAGLSIDQKGIYTLKATDTALKAAASNSFTVLANSSTAHLVLIQQPAPTLVGKPFTPPILLKVEDQFGNLDAGASSKVTLTLANSPTGVTLTGLSAINAVRGVATFNDVKLSLAGIYTLQAQDNSLPITAPVSFTQTITPAATRLTPPAVSPSYITGHTIKLKTTLLSNAPAAIPFTGTVTLIDQNNNILATATRSPAGALTFTLTAPLPGTYLCTLAYPGDPNHTPITTAPFALLIKAAPTS